MLDDKEHHHVADAMQNIADTLIAKDAEIKRLQEAKRRALAVADERSKENVELRAALKPFADEADWFDGYGDACPLGSDPLMPARKLNVGALRRAKTAYEQKPDKNSHQVPDDR